MSNRFTKGLLKGLLYYAIGAAVTFLAYQIFGWEYKHGPGFHHLTGLLFLAGGAGWILYSCRLLLTGQQSRVNFGLLTVHLVFVLGALGYVTWSTLAYR